MKSNAQCSMCIFGCKNEIPNDIPCKNLTLGMTVEEINHELKEQNVNLRRLANQYYLKYPKLIEMLNGKLEMHYKYRVALMNRLKENSEFDEYYARFEDGE